MSTRRMLFTLVLVLAAVATPAAAADLDPAEPTLSDIFAEPAPISAEPVPALQPGVPAQARSTCLFEGEKAWIWTGACCVPSRQIQDQFVCTGGVWVPTGRTRCFVPSCFD